MKAISVNHGGCRLPLTGGGPFHGHKFRLTIGVIAKNEEKTLDKCLASLKPLLDAVPGELIFTDTGSTDRTVAIAEKYTKHLIHFPWKNDFSAARNTGLAAAQGEWFLYLDADEWFDDVAPLVDFFSSGECDRYNMAAYSVRNYTDFSGKNYDDIQAARIVRILPATHFKNTVHEDLLRQPPIKMLDAFVHHYGYAYRTDEERERHGQRNMSLLKAELKQTPDDLKALFQTSLQLLGSDDAEAARIAERGMGIALKRGERYSYLRLANSLLRARMNQHDYKKVLDEVPSMLLQIPETGLFHLEFGRMCQEAAYQLKEYEKSAEFGKRCLKLYEKEERGELDDTERLYIPFHYLTDNSRQRCLLLISDALLQLGKAEAACDYWDCVDLSYLDAGGNGSFSLSFQLADKTGSWSIPVKFYRKLLAQSDKAKERNFMAYADSYCYNYPSRRKDILSAFAETEDDGGYFLLCRIRIAAEEHDRDRVAALLRRLTERGKNWDVRFADAVYGVLLNKMNLMEVLDSVDFDDIPLIASELRGTHDDFPRIVANYFSMYSFRSPKALYLAVTFLECAVLRESTENPPEQYRKLILLYLENSSKYVRAVYKPELLAESGLPALPRVCRFGYYAGKAIRAQQGNHPADYLKNLRLGLKEYPAMEKPIKFLLDDFKSHQKERKIKSDEFAVLAKQVKANIESLIAQGKLKRAGVYTLQLAKLIPEDDDLRRYRRLTHTEPDMAELVARIPQ